LKPHNEEGLATRDCCGMEKTYQTISFFSVVGDYRINIYIEMVRLTMRFVA